MVETRSARKAKQETPRRRAASPGAEKKKTTTPKATGNGHAAHGASHGTKDAAVEYEFGGPVGAGANVVLLPLVVVGLAVACDEDFCVGPSAWSSFAPPAVEGLASAKAFGVVFAWLAFQAALQVFLPGDVVEGTTLPDGRRLPYLINGHLAFWVSLGVLAVGCPVYDGAGAFAGLGAWDLAFLYDEFVPLAVAASVVSLGLSVLLYAASFRSPKPLLAAPGDTGSPVYDFWMGRELNPRIGAFDLKCFCELRPGLIGWAVLNYGMLCKQRELTGKVSGPMLCVNAFQLLYVWDALFYEKVILTTMDITTDGFGYMLAFGDLAWVPFTYCLQARFLVHRDPGLSTLTLALIVALQAAGYAIFRGANNQKDAFRKDPNKAIADGTRFLDTKRGTKLITSGYWGAARKINYTGDWLMSLAWCLLAGFESPIPYFYSTYFLILLVHRAMRDDHACAAKYGADWPEYKKKVPYLFVPFLF